MAADNTKPFFPVESVHHPRKARALTPEARFWRSFKTTPVPTNLILPVTAIEFSPAAPHDLTFAVSASVHLYDGASLSRKPFSPLASFSDVAYSPSFRCDGQLLATGGESGLVQVFKLNKAGRAIRRLRAHSRPVHVVRYPRVNDKLHLFSAGDDALLAQWDVAAETQLLTIPGAHKDYIRAGSTSTERSEVIATGSYDHSIKVWDVRVSTSPVQSFNHGDPVESVLFLPSATLLATAGGNCVKIWDVVGGGRLIHTMSSHNKTVTSMCLGRVGDENSGESRILSVSIDGYLKSFDFASFKVTHSMRYPAQLLSVGFSPSGSARVVGASNGTIYIGKKKKREDVEMSKVTDEFSAFRPVPEEKVLRPSNARYFHRGQNEMPLQSDFVVQRQKKTKLAMHDKLLKKFRQKDALVCVLNQKNPNSIVAVMEELVARKKLVKCVMNLDADELGLLQGFLHRYATLPRHTPFLLGVAKKVLELRTEDLQSPEELRHVRNIKRMVEEEKQIQRELLQIQGMISPLLTIAGR